MVSKVNNAGKSVQNRGRTVSSKPSNDSTRLRRTNSASSNVSVKSSASKTSQSRTRSASDVRSKTTSATSSQSGETTTISNISVTTVELKSSSKPSASSSSNLPPPIEEQANGPTSDPLQISAQAYPWLYMTSTLEACFQSAEEAAKKDLEKYEAKLVEDEAVVADQSTRLDAEGALDFYDELSTEPFLSEAPVIMQSFLAHGDICGRVETEALELSTREFSADEEDIALQAFSGMLDTLEELQYQASQLEVSILKLTSPTPTADKGSETNTAADSSSDSEHSPHSRLLSLFSSCLPLLRARVDNLSMAQELVDSAQENFTLGLRMESLGIE